MEMSLRTLVAQLSLLFFTLSRCIRSLGKKSQRQVGGLQHGNTAAEKLPEIYKIHQY